ISLEVEGKMVVKVRGIIAAHAEDAPALGWPRFRSPEHRRHLEGPGGQRDASGQTRLEQLPTTHTLDDAAMSLRCFHQSPSLLRSAPKGLSNCCTSCDRIPSPSVSVCGQLPVLWVGSGQTGLGTCGSAAGLSRWAAA